MADEEQTMLTEGLFSLVGNIAQKGLAYGFLVAATYLVAPERFGVYVWALSTLMLVYGWSNLNVYRSLSYFVPRYAQRGDWSELGATVFKVATVSLVPVSLVGFGIYWQAERIVALLGRSDAVEVVVLLVPMFWLLLARDLITELFRGLERVRYAVYVQSLCYPLVHLVSLLVFIAVFEPTVALAFAFTVSWGVALLLGGILLGTLDVPVVLRRDLGPSVREIVSYSLPLFAGGLFGRFITQMDIILLGVLLGQADPGFFQIALSVASLSAVFPSMFKSISKPVFSRLEVTDDEERLQSVYLTSSRWGLLASVPVAVYLIAVPEAFVGVFFAEGYSLAATVVPVLVVSNVFPTLWGYGSTLLEGSGHTRLIFARVVLTFVVNLVLDLALIPRMGILGAAIGSTTAGVVGGVFEVGLIKYIHGGTVTSWTHRAGLGSGVLAFITLTALRPLVPTLVVVFGFPVVTMVVYVGGLLVSGGLYGEDITQMRSAAEKINSRIGLDLTGVVDTLDMLRRPPLYR